MVIENFHEVTVETYVLSGTIESELKVPTCGVYEIPVVLAAIILFRLSKSQN